MNLLHVFHFVIDSIIYSFLFSHHSFNLSRFQLPLAVLDLPQESDSAVMCPAVVLPMLLQPWWTSMVLRRPVITRRPSLKSLTT